MGILDTENEKPADAGLFGDSGDRQVGKDFPPSTSIAPHTPGATAVAASLSPRTKHECHTLATASAVGLGKQFSRETDLSIDENAAGRQFRRSALYVKRFCDLVP